MSEETVVKIGGGITMGVCRRNPGAITVTIIKQDWDTERKEIFHWIFSIDLPEDKRQEIIKVLNEV